jgi:hypothetical protein
MSANSGKKMSDEKCQSIIWNLIEHFQAGSVKDLPPDSIIRAIMQTKRCDGHLDDKGLTHLKDMRDSYKGFIDSLDEDAMDSIAKVSASSRQKDIAADAIVHYHHYTTKWCVNALNQKNWWYYQLVFKTERNLYFLGLPPVLLGAYGAAVKARPFLKNLYNSKK